MDIPGEIGALIICLVLAAAGGAVVTSGSDVAMLITVGWIFLAGGLLGAAATLYAMFKG